MKREWDEAQIAAYLDHELPPAEAEEVAALIERDPEARAYAQKLQRADDLFRAAFPLPEGAMPDGIGKVLTAPSAANDNVTVFSKRSRRPVWQALALAASLAVAVGLGAMLDGGTGPGRVAMPGTLPDDGALHAALETLPSGERSAAGVMPMLTFRDGGGRYCREFEVSGELPGELELGIACRTAGDLWHVEVIATAPESQTMAADQYVPASGPAMAALDTVLRELGGGLPLSPEEENDAIKGNWRN